MVDVLNPIVVLSFPAASRVCFAFIEILPSLLPVPSEERRIDVGEFTSNLSELEFIVSSATTLRLFWLPAFISGILIILFPFESIV